MVQAPCENKINISNSFFNYKNNFVIMKTIYRNNVTTSGEKMLCGFSQASKQFNKLETAQISGNIDFLINDVLP